MYPKRPQREGIFRSVTTQVQKMQRTLKYSDCFSPNNASYCSEISTLSFTKSFSNIVIDHLKLFKSPALMISVKVAEYITVVLKAECLFGNSQVADYYVQLPCGRWSIQLLGRTFIIGIEVCHQHLLLHLWPLLTKYSKFYPIKLINWAFSSHQQYLVGPEVERQQKILTSIGHRFNNWPCQLYCMTSLISAMPLVLFILCFVKAMMHIYYLRTGQISAH